MAFSKNSVRLTIPQHEIDKVIRGFKDFGHSVEKSKEGERLFDNALKKAVKPWQDNVNKGKAYKYITKVTGMSKDPFGNQKIKGKRSGVYGRRVGPKKGKKNGGWRIHFFATPAKQISSKKKIPFRRFFREKNGDVVTELRFQLKELLFQLALIHLRK